MAPSGSTLDFEHNPSPRPLKRARKSSTAVQKVHGEPEEHQFVNNAPLDHIFIADGIASKKPGGKKAPLSCCECRRLKLKCDRSFPCASCKKRGCAEICPDGVLVSGKGTRFILANTEHLHSKIQEMSDRIRSLEDGLQTLYSEHASDPDEPHPLMQPELLGIKSTMGLYSGTQNSSADSPPKSNNGNGQRMDIDPAKVERGSSEDTLASPDHHALRTMDESTSQAQMAAEIVRLSHNFPLSDTISPEGNLRLRQYIRSHLPPREEADYLWEQARQNALWQYNPHSSSTFYPNLAYHCYTSDVASLSPRRLALLFMILAVGCLVDIPNREPDHPDAEKYHQFARASLCEIPVMEETNVETITALFYEIWYLLVFSDKKKAAGYAWGLMGLTAKLAQSIGLHRNGGKSKMIPEEVERRRSLFWELLYLDARLSLSLGRPPSLSRSYMDCPPPSYTPDEDCDISLSSHYYQEWKHKCYEACLAPVLDAISKPHLEYDTVLDLDKRIRDFSIPSSLRNKDVNTRAIVMQRASLSTALEAVLLQLHRQFFTRALSGPEEAFNRRHKYAPSVVAVFLSATRMIANVEELYLQEPDLTARILGYWSNAFSAAVALCLLVSRAPFTCLSPAALQELERARLLFRSAKDRCPRALQVIPVLETMIDKANHIYTSWSEGQEVPTIVLKHITEDPYSENDGNSTNGQGNGYQQQQYVQQQHQLKKRQSNSDIFVRSHRSLTQCIVEAHQRAKAIFPLRKPCQCSNQASQNCPPSHSWSPPPLIGSQSQTSPVLPPELPPSAMHFPRMSPGPAGFTATGSPAPMMNREYSPASNSAPSPGYVAQQHSFEGIYTHQVLPSDGPPVPSAGHTLSQNSKLAVVDTINFEMGALDSKGDQAWMAFF
ncbi:hypothetical protein BDN70DRAFT_885835 [Pholiota conissans]|uniref:Zn(2)-C6 fungal-type domain-containing protein n=1 Tax=Pholiota conissans TaxID=109636 RepID=A0A9P5YTE5_9AGAR|nr:hypothetical protein BDN70DRAFT_885835 [Pholiota conissans]